MHDFQATPTRSASRSSRDGEDSRAGRPGFDVGRGDPKSARATHARRVDGLARRTGQRWRAPGTGRGSTAWAMSFTRIRTSACFRRRTSSGPPATWASRCRVAERGGHRRSRGSSLDARASSLAAQRQALADAIRIEVTQVAQTPCARRGRPSKAAPAAFRRGRIVPRSAVALSKRQVDERGAHRRRDGPHTIATRIDQRSRHLQVAKVRLEHALGRDAIARRLTSI